jgi:hypothetical protein
LATAAAKRCVNVDSARCFFQQVPDRGGAEGIATREDGVDGILPRMVGNLGVVEDVVDDQVQEIEIGHSTSPIGAHLLLDDREELAHIAMVDLEFFDCPGHGFRTMSNGRLSTTAKLQKTPVPDQLP